MKKERIAMKRIYLSLILKIILVFVAAWISYSLIEENPLLWVFISALAVALLSFLVGDMLVLPRYGNISAALADAVIGGIVAWIVDLLTPRFYITWVSTLVFVVLIFIIEIILHRYIAEKD